MALTYATMGAIVKASEQSRKPAPVVLSGESISAPGDLGEWSNGTFVPMVYWLA